VKQTLKASPLLAPGTLVSDPSLVNRSASRQVEQRLRDMIIRFEFAPGERLSEQEIALKFGISRQPVREALIALAKAELVKIVPQRGTFVVKISSGRMFQSRFIREQIEVGVVRHAAEKGINEVSITMLNELIKEQKSALKQNDVSAFKIHDEAFHENLSHAAGLDMAWRAIGDFKSHIDRACYLTLTDPTSLKPLIAQHQEILKAVVERKADDAEKAMRHHLTDLLRALPHVMSKNPDYFE
jgi:GntR family transcriptional regulator, rspAB operon transcriptional repressor